MLMYWVSLFSSLCRMPLYKNTLYKGTYQNDTRHNVIKLTTLSIMTLVILSVYLTTLSIIRLSIKANKICSCTGCHIVQNVIILNVVDPLLMHLNARLVSSLGSIKISAAVEKKFCIVSWHKFTFLDDKNVK
jgi:hypothetical protein